MNTYNTDSDKLESNIFYKFLFKKGQTKWIDLASSKLFPWNPFLFF